MNAVVLTSENSAEFYAKRLNLAPEPAAAEPVKTEPVSAVESAERDAAIAAEREAAEQQAEADHPDPEKKQKLNLRFSELSKQRDEAKALAEKNAAETKAAREALELAERRAAELTAKYEPPKANELGPEPTRAQFSTDEDFLLALKDHAGEKAVRERDQKEAENKRIAAWTERQKAVKAETPDYDAVLAGASNLMVSNEVRDAILESDAGPQILYHLAKNPDVVAQLKTKSKAGALLMIGRLDAEFVKAIPAKDTTKVDPAKPAAAATENSRAPAPITPLKGSGNAVTGANVDSDGVYHGSYAQWKADRKAGRIK